MHILNIKPFFLNTFIFTYKKLSKIEKFKHSIIFSLKMIGLLAGIFCVFFCLHYKECWGIRKTIMDYLQLENVYLFPDEDLIVLSDITFDEIDEIINSTGHDYDKILNIFINSDGGDYFAGYNLIKHFEVLKTNHDVVLHCFATKAHSISFDIFQHCSNRFVSPTVSLYQHPPQYEGILTLEELHLLIHSVYVKTLSKIKRMTEELDIYTSDLMGLDYDVYKKLIQNGFHIKSGNDAVNYGLADQIVLIQDLNTILKYYDL